MSIEDVPSTSCLVKAFIEGFYQKYSNLNKVNHPLSIYLGIQNMVILNEVFDLRFMPLFLVKHLVITLNPNNQGVMPQRRCQTFHF